MSAEHPSRRSLDRYSVDDLPAAERQEVAAHLEGCPRCRGLLDDLAALQAAQLAALPPPLFLEKVAARREAASASEGVIDLAERRARRPNRTLGRISMLVAAAALVALLPRLHTATGPLTDDEIRLKGTGFSLLRQRGAEVGPLPAEATIRAGDAIEVAATLGAPSKVAVWFVDASGRVDALLEGGSTSLPVGRSTLPGSARVESPCVDMTVVAASGEAIAAVEGALRGGGGGRAGIEAARALPGTFTQLLRCE